MSTMSIPTMELRFVKRIPDTNAQPVRFILQQKWHVIDLGEGSRDEEWRDVPVEDET